MHRSARRTIAALTAIAATTAVAGCGGASAGGGKQLHILVGANAQYGAQYQAWLDKIKQRFKAKTGADITYDTFSGASDEQTKIQTSLVSGDGPDIYQVGTTFTPVAYATKGFHVLSGSDWQKIGGRQRFLPQSLAVSGPDQQHQIGIPMSIRPYGMVYNKEMFKAAGITQPPKSWNELITDANKVAKPSAGLYGMAAAYGDGYSPWKYIWMNALQSGGRLLSDDLKRAELDSPPVVSATTAYFDLLAKDHLVDPQAVSWKDAQALAAFSQGKAGILGMVTPSVVPSLEKSSVKGKYAFAPMPLVPSGVNQRPSSGLAAGSIVSGDDLAIASYSKNTELALQYINMVTSQDVQKEYSQNFGDLPANAQAAQQLANSNPQNQAFLRAEKTSVPTSFTGAWSDVELGLQNVVKQSLPKLANGSYNRGSVQQLLAQANQKAQASLDRHK
jgi:multiple sugar transport system substrate-binding protein